MKRSPVDDHVLAQVRRGTNADAATAVDSAAAAADAWARTTAPRRGEILGRAGALLRAKDNAAFDDLPQLLRLARLPNVAVKASALPAYSSHDYPYYNLHPYLRRVFDAFGPRRMFWGTDLTRLPCTYRQAITLFTEELPWLSAADQEWVMGRAVCDWLGWPIEDFQGGVE